MKHRKYERIEGTWHEKTVEYFKENGFFDEDIEWCVTEKVHGSNFAFYLEQNTMLVAKRSNFLQDGENFFQYQRMAEKDAYKCQQIWDDLVINGVELETLIIYGELFGGFYPHPEVQNIGSVRKIQKGVWYHPDVCFYAYDIWIKTSTYEGFLDYDLAIDLFEKNDLFHAKILKKGTYEECSKYPIEFQTNIPKWLNLPLMDKNEKHTIKRLIGGYHPDEEPIYKELIYYGNICEGVVLKPIISIMLESGERIILKSKNEIFKEVSGERKGPKTRKKVKSMTEYAGETVELIIPYINENRLRNVLSKHGEFKKSEFNDVYKAFKEDIYEDFKINYDNLEFCDIVDLKMIDKEVGRLCIEIWRPIFLKECI